MELKDILKYMRENANLTRKQVADALEISDKTIQGYEYGMNKNPPEKYLIGLCALSGYSTMIFQENTEADIEEAKHYKLCKFSHAIALLALYSGQSEENILWSFIKGYSSGEEFKVKRFNNIYADFRNVSIHYDQNEEINRVLEPIWHKNKEEGRLYFLKDTATIIANVNKYKPSIFGITIDTCIESKCNQEITERIRILESEGVQPNKEELKSTPIFDLQAIFKSATKKNEAKREGYKNIRRLKEADALYELFQYAPKLVQDKIMATLKKYKQQADELDDI